MKTIKIPKLLIALLCISLAALSTLAAAPAHAQDGRINQIPWVNGWGAVAVYCMSAEGYPSSSYENGGSITILGATGDLIAKFTEAQIKPKRTKSDKDSVPLNVGTQGIYSLYTLPENKFLITSLPDSEGKTVIGQWTGCIPVSNPGESVPDLAVCRVPAKPGYINFYDPPGLCQCPIGAISSIRIIGGRSVLVCESPL